MKTTFTKYYENKETVYSESFCLYKTGILNKIQIAFNFIKSRTFQEVSIILNLLRL